MRYTFEAFIGILIFSCLIDYLLFKHLRGLKPKGRSHFSLPLGTFWFYSVPVLFSSVFAYYVFVIPVATRVAVYVQFQWFMLVYLLIYLPKYVYFLTYKVGRLFLFLRPYLTFKGTVDKMNKGRYPKVSRAKFLSQVGIITASLPFVSMLFGVMKGRFLFTKTFTELRFKNLPAAFDGLRLVHISDLHLGSFNSHYEELEAAFDMINEEKPDLIFFTGDLVNNFHEETVGWERVFLRLKASIGKYSVLGNHDYGDYSRWTNEADKIRNFKGIKSAHERFGFELLNNESVVLKKRGEELAIVGVENWGHKPFPKYGDLPLAMKGVERIPFKLLLSHDPDHWDAQVLPDTNIDLTLAGHTHGMQLGFKYKAFQWSPAKYKFRRWSGLYREGNQCLYVNTGLGFLGIPARIGMRPEITVITLHKG